MSATADILPDQKSETEVSPLPASTLPTGEEAKKYRGKIPKLSKAQRDQINKLLENGAMYDHVAEIMNAEHGVGLNKVNVYNWYHSGFQDYLNHQDWLTEMRNVREGASDLIEPTDTLKLHQSANQLAVLQILKTLMNDTLKDDHINRIRSMNALSRLSREALVFKKYENALAKEQPDLSSKAGGTDAPSKEELDRQLLDKSDDFFGLKSPARLQAEWQAAASAQSSNGKDAVHRVPIISGVDTPGEAEGTPNLGPVVLDAGPEVGLPVPLVALKPESESACAPKSAICDLPSAIQIPKADSMTENPPAISVNPPEPVVETPSTPSCSLFPSVKSDSDICVNPCPSVVETPSSPQIENRKSAFENPPHPDLLTCPCCHADLPPLLPDGQRPDPFCPKCRSALRHPATLKFYCPSCRGNIRSIWQDDHRTSDNCPTCYAHLPPPPIWPPLAPPPKSPETTNQLAHAE